MTQKESFVISNFQLPWSSYTLYCR